MTEVCRAEGLEYLPDELAFEHPPVPGRIGPEVVFTQTCGYPLQTIYAGQAALLAHPLYAAPGCEDACHTAVLVVRQDSRFETLEDLRGAVFALNSLHSNSGMNLPRRLIAPRARDGRFFGEVVMTGGHGPSMTRVADAGVDAASIDCLTYAAYADHRPEVAAQLRVLAYTPASPSIPFVTSIETPPATRTALTRALFRLAETSRHEPVLRALRIVGMAPALQPDYDAILDYEAEAANLGYPVIA